MQISRGISQTDEITTEYLRPNCRFTTYRTADAFAVFFELDFTLWNYFAYEYYALRHALSPLRS